MKPFNPGPFVEDNYKEDFSDLQICQELDELMIKHKVTPGKQVYVYLVQLFTLFGVAKCSRKDIIGIMTPFFKKIEEK